MPKSNAVFDIVSLIRLDVITYDDLADFSDDLQQAVQSLLMIHYSRIRNCAVRAGLSPYIHRLPLSKIR